MVKKLLLFTPILLLILLPTNTYAVNYKGNLSVDLIRYYGNTTVNSSQGGTASVTRPTGIDIYFNALSYNNYGGDWYAVFSGRTYVDDASADTTTGSQFNTSLLPTVLVDGSAQNPNSCFLSNVSNTFTANGWTTIAWVATCKLDNVLHSGYASNILRFTVSNGRNGNVTNLTTTMDTDFYLLSNPFGNEGQSVINSITNQTSAITNNQNQNTQDIIDNQNANNQQQIESQKVCDYIDKSDISIDKSYLAYDGTVNSSNNYGITNYINIENSTLKQLTLQSSSNAFLCFYYEDKTLINCISSLNHGIGDYVIPNNAKYIRASIIKSENKPTYNICKNGNQALNDGINSLNDSITSESTPDTSNSINDMNNSVASDTPISDLITMPLTLMNAYINGMNATCSSYNLGNLLGTNLVLPCINIPNLIGSNLWSIIDVIVSIFLIFNISKLFISAFDSLTSLKDNFGDLYYHGKHEGGDN